MPDVVEVVQVLGSVVEVDSPRITLVEIPAAVGPRGPIGPQAVVTADQLQQIADEVEAELDDGPDLVLLYLNSKA